MDKETIKESILWEEINMTIKVVVGGPRGKMGTEAVKMIENEQNIELVAVIDKQDNNGTDDNEVKHIPVFHDAESCFKAIDADVYVDLTIPKVGFTYTKQALSNNIHAVVGTSGFSEEQIDTLSSIAKQNDVGCIIAPNFAIGAVLMMLFSKMAAKYFPNVEIIEKHHDQKIDAPSGTAVKTADIIKEERKPMEQGHPDEYEIVDGVRGGNIDGIRIHSMRLPGLVAHQEVVFGSNSQLLSIKHDSFHRESFMDGLKLAIEQVVHLNELVYGLEHVMDLN